MEYQMGAAEMRFAEILWEAAPLSSGELVRLSAEKLGWKKSTVYTVLRRLCEKGLFRNEGGTVTVLVDRASFEESRSRQFVSESFGGSLPAFLAAFTARKKLTGEEIAELQRLIDEAKEER
ncbi:MAG: BlaI/MecI/CopY family transcriptional regulator [Oscillospiraceae bacterium]|nr:BlaI/MecI/CopY family transcriptional regulator [Oscillospiraceae bacterium]